MFPRFLLPVGLLVLIGTGCRNTNDGSVKITVAYEGFKPGCIRVSVKDAEGAGEVRTTELAGKGEVTGGAVTLAAFRESGWSNTLSLTAEAFETQCTDAPVVTTTELVTVNKGEVAEKELKLTATDADHDGYVSVASGGSDCDDNGPEVNPGKTELCNGRDDNCDGKHDESFDVGALCDATDGCQGAWACDPQGARTCVAREGQWHPDADNDGYGSNKVPGVSSCKQPAGHVANDLDCDDGNSQRYTGALELCNAVDDNCDGTVDDGLAVGTSCDGGKGCPGTRVCASDGSVKCDSPEPTVLYADTDKDTHGAADAKVTICDGTTPPGYVTSSDDCDDTRASVYPGAKEICDELDNNCNSTTDEGFALGESCDPGNECQGVTACAADGSVKCAFVVQPTSRYVDDDLDTYGDPNVLTCIPDTGVTQAGDCNDGNPFTHPGARELCDLEDNNCDNSPDEGGVCPAEGGKWAAQSLPGSDWKSVAVWGDGSTTGGVWIAGAKSSLRERLAGQTSFVNRDNKCKGEWNSLWVHPQEGYALLGGNAGLVATHASGTTNCGPSEVFADATHVMGTIRLPLPDGGLETYAVGPETQGAGGRVVWGTDASSRQNISLDGMLSDVHGISRDVLFAVGGNAGASPRIYRYRPDRDDWMSEDVQNIPDVVPDRLWGVWVVNSKLAYAVGNRASVLMWNGKEWSKHSAPKGETLTSVLAFGKNSIYVTTIAGGIFRYNGSTWSQVPGTTNLWKPLNDIAGTSPEDIWVVGNGANVIHWPR